MTNFQRKGAISNAHVGREFEIRAKAVLEEQLGVDLDFHHKVSVGIEFKKEHAFDLGSENPRVIVECKAQTWTEGNKVPSSKMKNWAEAMFIFYMTPKTYRKIFIAERSERKTTGESLLSYFMRTHIHMIPADVEFWEFDSATGNVRQELPVSKQIQV